MSDGWPADLERLRGVIARDLGLQMDDGKLAVLAELLGRRTEAVGEPVGSYLDHLEEGPPPQEIRAFAAALTIGETYFFRNAEQFRALAEVVLPARATARAATRTLRLLSAGCSSGEEAHTLAIVARDQFAGTDWSVLIRAVDVNPDAVARARRGRYSAWSLRETPPEAQARWFRRDGSDLLLDESIRAAVKFEERNLVRHDADLWVPGAYDVVFCRNMMMYFTPEQQRGLIDRIARSLAPGGYLFLGHAETLRGLSHDFHLLHSHGAFYYQRRDPVADARAERELERRPRPSAPPDTTAPTAAAGEPDAIDWTEQIRLGAERIRQLGREPAPRRSAGPRAAASAARSPELGPALDLLRRERFAEALVDLDRLTATSAAPEETAAASSGDPDVMLLRAALLTHSGRLDEAEAACTGLLARDELNAGAHYLLALCRERHGDPRGAAEHDQVAAYLDPAFAMPRLHLGLMARRAGDREAARRELGQAALLLPREEAGRILLFGGGFTRETLVALCDAGLAAVGGAT
jgi:chemotaxis protein methyltransferase CheR